MINTVFQTKKEAIECAKKMLAVIKQGLIVKHSKTYASVFKRA